MCSTCTTVFDVSATNAVLVGAFVVNRWERLRDRMRSKPRLERDLETWEANAAFIRSLGHEPLAVLGAPPTIDVLPVDNEVTPPVGHREPATQQ